MTEPLNPDWDGIMKARARELKPRPIADPAGALRTETHEATHRALEYAKKIVQNYEAAVKASAWTGVNLEAVGFCQDTNYKDALATIDKIARGELVV